MSDRSQAIRELAVSLPVSAAAALGGGLVSMSVKLGIVAAVVCASALECVHLVSRRRGRFQLVSARERTLINSLLRAMVCIGAAAGCGLCLGHITYALAALAITIPCSRLLFVGVSTSADLRADSKGGVARHGRLAEPKRPSYLARLLGDCPRPVNRRAPGLVMSVTVMAMLRGAQPLSALTETAKGMRPSVPSSPARRRIREVD